MPTPTDLSLDTVQLSTLSVKVGGELTGFIAEEVFPILKVDKKDGYFYTFDNSHLRIDEMERGSGARASRGDYGRSTTAYGPLVDFEHEVAVDDFLSQQSPIDEASAAVQFLTHKMKVFKENKLAALLNDTGVVTNNTTLTGTNQWTDQTNSDPFGDIETGITSVVKKSGEYPNTIVFGHDSWAKFRQHPDTIERVKHVWGSGKLGNVQVSQADAEQLLGMKVLVGSKPKNSADEGAADSLGFIWPDSCWVSYVAPSASNGIVTAGFHFELNGAQAIDTYRDDSIRSNVVRIVDFFKPKVVAVGAIYLIKDTNA
jgi:hypothetical protein